MMSIEIAVCLKAVEGSPDRPLGVAAPGGVQGASAPARFAAPMHLSTAGRKPLFRQTGAWVQGACYRNHERADITDGGTAQA
jgi:hypothetical protein